MPTLLAMIVEYKDLHKYELSSAGHFSSAQRGYVAGQSGVMKARKFTADNVAYSMNRSTNSKKASSDFNTFVDRWEVVDKHTFIILPDHRREISHYLDK